MYVQRLDDSRVAFRITYRISLRSSSSQEPRYPLLKVVISLRVSWKRRRRLTPDADVQVGSCTVCTGFLGRKTRRCGGAGV